MAVEVKFFPTREALRIAQESARKRLSPNRSQRRARGASEYIDPTGIKRWYVDDSGDDILTPYARKERKRRRAASKVAKQARKVNRGLHRTGGRR